MMMMMINRDEQCERCTEIGNWCVTKQKIARVCHMPPPPQLLGTENGPFSDDLVEIAE